jgi:hypothetical protein
MGSMTYRDYDMLILGYRASVVRGLGALRCDLVLSFIPAPTLVNRGLTVPRHSSLSPCDGCGE